jgi:short-subunit dehydrogenase
MSTKSEQNCVWIVGASTGIGAALASLYAANNPDVHLILSARSEGKLHALAAALAPVKCSVLALDVSENLTESGLVQRVAEVSQEVDTVVINAGTCEYMDSDNVDLEMARRVMETNFFGAIQLTQIALPLLRAARDKGRTPHLVFVSSSVTYQSLPRAHAYGSSKAALRYFAECMRIDLQNENIEVQVVSPGFVETPMTDQNDFDMPFIVSSEAAAQKIYDGIRKNTFDISFPKAFTWTLKGLSKLPSKLRFSILSKMSRHSEVQHKELASKAAVDSASKPESTIKEKQ